MTSADSHIEDKPVILDTITESHGETEDRSSLISGTEGPETEVLVGSTPYISEYKVSHL